MFLLKFHAAAYYAHIEVQFTTQTTKKSSVMLTELAVGLEPLSAQPGGTVYFTGTSGVTEAVAAMGSQFRQYLRDFDE